MKWLLLALLSLTSITLALSNETTVAPVPFEELPDVTHSLVQLTIGLSQSKLPGYIVDIIFDHPVENGVSSQSVIDLFKITSLNLTTTQSVLQALNISSDNAINVNNLNRTLEIVGQSFQNFYSTLTARLNLVGTPLQNAIEALQIDFNQFAIGLAIGSPDPWLTFSQGNFTTENIQLACQAANITLDHLFTTVVDIFASSFEQLSIQDLLLVLQNNSITKVEALTYWNVIGISPQDVSNIEVFANILRNFTERFNNQTFLGVLTGHQELAINRATYGVFKDDRELLEIFAHPIMLTQRRFNVSTANDTIYRNIVILMHSGFEQTESVTTIGTGLASQNLHNCTYLTISGSSLLSFTNQTAVYNDGTYEVSLNTGVHRGSALICNNTLYGLARERVGDNIVLDGFVSYDDHNVPSSSSPSPIPSAALTTVFNGLVLLFLFIATMNMF